MGQWPREGTMSSTTHGLWEGGREGWALGGPWGDVRMYVRIHARKTAPIVW